MTLGSSDSVRYLDEDPEAEDKPGTDLENNFFSHN
jgi:hypothetical protein